MKSVSELTVLVFGHGLEIPVAERLARDCKRVLYHTPWETGFSTVNAAVIGDGLDNVERVEDIWLVKKEVDLFVFPDLQHAGVQLELEAQGYPVWGSRRADRIELNREHFLKILAQVGLDVPEHAVIEGVTKLREFLKDKEDYYIKISKYRGSLETKHWRSWKLDENLIDLWAVRFGAVRDYIRFLCFPAINTPLEIGCDTYCIDGKWPSLMLNGIEAKDKSYFSSVTPQDQMPDQVQAVLQAFGPVFAPYRYRNEFSMEIRVDGERAYFIDPTTRLGLPSTSSQLELWSNWTEIVWAGAHGELVDPVPVAKHSAELIVTTKSDESRLLWPTVEVPPDLKQWLKLSDCCEVDGVRSWPRDGKHDDAAGWLVAIGDTPQETLDTLKGYVDLLPDGLECDIAPLAEVIKEIETMDKEGVDESPPNMPQPEEVIA